MNKNPLVSVFIPYYNDKAFIADAIEACLKQTYQNFELFLFNHASTDTSRNIAHSFDDPRIIHIDAEKNLGAGSGLNLKNTLSRMQGKYVKLLCADDMMKPDFLAKTVNYMENHKDVDFCFSDAEFIDEKNKKIKGSRWSENHNYDFNYGFDGGKILRLLFIRHSPLLFPASLIRKRALNDISLDATSIMCFDVILWSDLLVSGKKLALMPDILFSYRVHPQQMSSVAQAKKANQRSFFETFNCANVFYNIKDSKTIKMLCRESPFVGNLTDDDREFFPFVVAHTYLKSIQYPDLFQSGHTVFQINGYAKMVEIMNNEALRQKIEKKFGYGIAEFRADYSWIDAPPKKTVAVENSKNLSFLRLLFLIIRRIWLDFRNIVTLRPLRKRKARRKQYTV